MFDFRLKSLIVSDNNIDSITFPDVGTGQKTRHFRALQFLTINYNQIGEVRYTRYFRCDISVPVLCEYFYDKNVFMSSGNMVLTDTFVFLSTHVLSRK